MAELSGFEVLTLLKEIGSTLRGTYINNIFTFGASQLIRLRRPEGDDSWLVVSPKKGVWLSRKVEGRYETSEFTSKLRRELERAKFAGASQSDLDRVFLLTFEGHEQRTLVVELMPPGNLLVIDPQGRIVLASEEVRSRTRRVVRGERYQPPQQARLTPSAVTAADVAQMLRQEKTAGSAIGKHIAMPKKYVGELLSRLGVVDDAPSVDLQGREAEVAETVCRMVEEAKANPRPCVAVTDRGDEVFVVPPTGLEVKEYANSLSQICDELFLEEAGAEVETGESHDGRRKELEVTISRLRSESEALRKSAQTARGAASEATAGVTERALLILEESGMKEGSRPSSPEAVASALYDHAKLLERRSAESLETAARLEKRLTRTPPPVRPRAKPLPKRKQEWYERFRWFTTSGGKLAVGGRDAQSNALLVKRHVDERDVVYHADLFGSPFFVLKGGREQSEAEVVELAQATVSFSSGWKTGLGAADAYWVQKEQVSGTAESGEYLAKGSFVIRGKKNFVRHVLVQVAVGVDGKGRVTAGPESAVASACPSYVVLMPHREKSSDTAKRVQRALVSGSGTQPPLDDVLRALPSGGGKIVRTKVRATGSGQAVL